jgi:hypothetical protein
MHLLIAGMFGIGGPEFVLIFIMAFGAVCLVVGLASSGRNPRPLGYCTRCGHPLQQPPDSRFCAYCASPVR